MPNDTQGQRGALIFSALDWMRDSGPGGRTAAMVSSHVSEVLQVYKTAEAYIKGTQFQLIIGARESAYVYAFAVPQSASQGSNFYKPSVS